MIKKLFFMVRSVINNTLNLEVERMQDKMVVVKDTKGRKETIQ